MLPPPKQVNTGDGSGLLVTIPDTYYRSEMNKVGIELPPREEYGTGLVFLSKDPALREQYNPAPTPYLRKVRQLE